MRKVLAASILAFFLFGLAVVAPALPSGVEPLPSWYGAGPPEQVQQQPAQVVAGQEQPASPSTGSGTQQEQVQLSKQVAASGDSDPWAPEDKGSTFEKIFAGLVAFPIRMAANLAQQGGFETLDRLVFGLGLSEEEKKNKPWNAEEAQVVKLWFEALCTVTLPFFVLVIAATGFRLLYGGLNPAARAEAIDSIQRWFLSAGVIILAPLVVQSLMWLASIMTDAVAGAFNSVAAGLGRNVQDWASVSLTGEGISTGSVVGTVVVRVFLTIMFFYLNVIYIIRKYVITVMFAFTPMMAILWAINRRSLAAAMWLGELASNAFMSTAHALALSTLMLICDVKNTGSWLPFTIMLYGVVPTAEALRNSLQSLLTRWAGIREESIARSAMFGALGLGGFLSLARVAGATFGGAGRIERTEGGTAGPGGLPGLSRGGLQLQELKTAQTAPAAEKPRRLIGFRAGEDGREGTTSGASGPVSAYGGYGSGGSYAPGMSPQEAASPNDYGVGKSYVHGFSPQETVPARFPYEVPPAPGRMEPPAEAGLVTADAARAPRVGYAHGAGVTAGTEGGQALSPPGRLPQQPTRFEKALRFGARAGKVAMAAAAMSYFVAGGAVPGGQIFAGAATLAAGYLGRATGTAGYLGGSYIASRAGDKLKAAAVKVKQVPAVQSVAGRIQKVGQQVMESPVVQKTVSVVQKTTTAVRKAGSAVKTVYDAVRVRYPDGRRGGLDNWRLY